MNTPANKPLHLPLLVAGIAAVLVSGIAIASLAISGQGLNGRIAPDAPAVAAPGAQSYRCAGCGVIESTREIEAPADKHGADASGQLAVCNPGEIRRHAPRQREITVRLQDGSMRVITDAKPAQWKRGEAVTIIAGMN
jgi:hypothetical protein